jgi:hypothetical protein
MSANENAVNYIADQFCLCQHTYLANNKHHKHVYPFSSSSWNAMWYEVCKIQINDDDYAVCVYFG